MQIGSFLAWAIVLIAFRRAMGRCVTTILRRREVQSLDQRQGAAWVTAFSIIGFNLRSLIFHNQLEAVSDVGVPLWLAAYLLSIVASQLLLTSNRGPNP